MNVQITFACPGCGLEAANGTLEVRENGSVCASFRCMNCSASANCVTNTGNILGADSAESQRAISAALAFLVHFYRRSN